MTPLRRAVTADCAEIARLVEKYWALESIAGFDQDRIVRLLQELVAHPDRGQCWIAGEPRAVRGYLLTSYLFSLEFGGTIAEIDELYVLDQCRSEGLGTALLQVALADMQRCHLVHVQLQLGVGNVRGRRFYQRQGFTARAGYELLGMPLAGSAP